MTKEFRTIFQKRIQCAGAAILFKYLGIQEVNLYGY